MGDPPECAVIRALIPELAAGAASGDERARALAHLAHCPECRRELAATTEVIDELLLLAPEQDPPVGFESSVLDHLAPASRRRRSVAAALVLILAPAGITAGALWQTTADDRELAAQYRHTLDVADGYGFSAAHLVTADGNRIGTVFAYQGSPSWAYTTFKAPPAPGTYEVRLLTKDGTSHPLRPFTATAGSADSTAWGSTLSVRVRDIASLQFMRSDNPAMSARFP